MVIPTFNAGAYLSAAIDSVRKAESLSSVRAKIIVIDNHPKAFDRGFSVNADEYFNLPSNPGFGAACNFGISQGSLYKDTNWILLLNPDARVSEDFFIQFWELSLSEDFVSKRPIMPLICFNHEIKGFESRDLFTGNYDLIEIMDQDDLFIVFNWQGRAYPYHSFDRKFLQIGDFIGLKPEHDMPTQMSFSVRRALIDEPLIVTFETSTLNLVTDFIIQNAGSEISSFSAAGDLNFGWLASKFATIAGGPRRAWCGAAVLLPFSYIREIGGFDETFFLYYEDTEFSYRGLKRGFLPTLEPTLRVFHQHSGITGPLPKLRSSAIWRSRQIFIARTSGRFFAILSCCFLTLKYMILLLLRRTTIRHFLKYLLPEIYFSFSGLFAALFTKRKFTHLELT